MRSTWITAQHLAGHHISLELLDPDRHRDGLVRAGAYADIWTYMLVPPADTPAGMDDHIRTLMARWDAGEEVPYVVIRQHDSCIVGSARFRELQPHHRSLELGTWLTPSVHGDGTNAELKLLMLTHAFEQLGCIRVQLKTDAQNTASQRSLAALGATYEGRLRNHIITPSGRIRDSLYYAITDAEWPAVKQHLIQRIERHQST